MDNRSWFARHKVMTVIGALILVSIVGRALDSGEVTPAATSAASASSAPAPKPLAGMASTTDADEPEPDAAVTDEPEDESEYGPQTKDKTSFIAAVTKAQDAAEDADNDMKLGAALSRRDKALCKIVGNGKVENWSGKITTLDANGEGKGVVSIEISEDVHVSTWNNAFSDYDDNTLIDSGRLFDKFLDHEEDDVVTFSGKLVSSDGCVNDKRLTLRGKLADPDFVFKFSKVS